MHILIVLQKFGQKSVCYTRQNTVVGRGLADDLIHFSEPPLSVYKDEQHLFSA